MKRRAPARPSLAVAAGLLVGLVLAGLATEAGAQWGYGYGTWNRGYYVPRQIAPRLPPRRTPTQHLLHQTWELPRPVGTIVARPPDGTEARRIGERTYFCHGPDFYAQTKDGFVVVVPPIGGTMNRAPLGSQRMQVNGRDHFYYNGVFVTKGPAGFEVVPSPLGAVVHRLPPTARTVKVGREKFYLVGDTCYERVFRGGNVAYRVVAPPARETPAVPRKNPPEGGGDKKPG